MKDDATQLVWKAAEELFAELPDAETTNDVMRAGGRPFIELLAQRTGLPLDLVHEIAHREDLLFLQRIDGKLVISHERPV